tara:strand:+ start:24 stop:167 length:144 start_codon:yes stop_codon:yes gene_type:complete
MMRDLKEELLTIKGMHFAQWYDSLTKLEKLEYAKIMKDLGSGVLSDK